MNELMVANKMTSMKIAEVVGKEHKNVIRDIRDEIDKLENAGVVTETKFELRERDGLTGKIPYYELTPEGVLQLAARYDAVVRAKLIELAMKKDNHKLPGTYKEALLALVEAEEEKERLLLDNSTLNTENNLLAQQQVTWADRRVIDALVKAYGSKIGFQEAWREFKKELLYKHSINLNSRLTQKINDTGRKNFKVLDMIHDDEITACISTAVAICRNNSIKIDAIINKYNIA